MPTDGNYEIKVQMMHDTSHNYPALDTILEWIERHAAGMAIHRASNRRDYLDSLDEVYLLHNMDDATDEPSADRYIKGLAAVKYHDTFSYEVAPYALDGDERVVTTVVDAAELCCLVMLPECRGRNFPQLLTSLRLAHARAGSTPVIKIRPSEATVNNLSVMPEASPAAATVERLAAANGFVCAGRSEQNSLVFVGSQLPDIQTCLAG